MAWGAAMPVGPTILENISKLPNTVEVTLTASPTEVSLVPNTTTAAYVYNGRIPGPTLEVHEGDRVIVHFRNDLPEPTTVHWHGLHIPVTSDGSPYYPIAPGRCVDYVFTLQKGSAGTYWYHPHPDHATGHQIAHGLFGAIIVRPAEDPLPPMTEQLLVLADNRFSTSGSIDWADPRSPEGIVDEVNGREGNLLFVNGDPLNVAIRSGEVQRGGSSTPPSSCVSPALPGQTFCTGSDAPVRASCRCREILPQQRARGSAGPRHRNSRSLLQALPYDRYVPQTRPKDWNAARDLLTLQYSADPPIDPIGLPDRLRPVPPLDPAKATRTRVISLSQGLINGRTMDMNRVDERARLGATEIWTVENLVGMDHPFHLHGFQFQVLDRNGVPEPFPSWKDTVNVPRHEAVRFIVRFDDFPGKWMFHCHILDHQDHGMMGVPRSDNHRPMGHRDIGRHNATLASFDRTHCSSGVLGGAASMRADCGTQAQASSRRCCSDANWSSATCGDCHGGSRARPLTAGSRVRGPEMKSARRFTTRRRI
jgi:bilirubin oxidase